MDVEEVGIREIHDVEKYNIYIHLTKEQLKGILEGTTYTFRTLQDDDTELVVNILPEDI